MNVTTWGELDSSWIGRSVLVRWEDATLPSVEGFPSRIPHEWHGAIGHGEYDTDRLMLYDRATDSFTGGFPDHALVQEAPK